MRRFFRSNARSLRSGTDHSGLRRAGGSLPPPTVEGQFSDRHPSLKFAQQVIPPALVALVGLGLDWSLENRYPPRGSEKSQRITRQAWVHRLASGLTRVVLFGLNSHVQTRDEAPSNSQYRRELARPCKLTRQVDRWHMAHHAWITGGHMRPGTPASLPQGWRSFSPQSYGGPGGQSIKAPLPHSCWCRYTPHTSGISISSQFGRVPMGSGWVLPYCSTTIGRSFLSPD